MPLFFFFRCFFVTWVNSLGSLQLSSLNSLASRSRGGEEAMDISLVEDIEGREKGPPDTWPESLELEATLAVTVLTVSRMPG